MVIVIAKAGEFIETLRKHAHEAVAVFPAGAAWGTITESDRAFEALLLHPTALLPTRSPG